MYAVVGVTCDKHVVCYCQTGVRASVHVFALWLIGCRHVSLYDGSWEEWGRRDRVPPTPRSFWLPLRKSCDMKPQEIHNLCNVQKKVQS